MWYAFQVARIAIEVISAAACFTLVRFMSIPYWFTREGRYLGLPLGFAFLGVAYSLAAIAFTIFPPTAPLYAEFSWIIGLITTFSFVYLAFTYFFSNETKNDRVKWNISFSILTVALFTVFIILIITPHSALQVFFESQSYNIIFDILCLSYISIHTLRSHVKLLDPTTIWIPSGFILLGISHYSLLFWS